MDAYRFTENDFGQRIGWDVGAWTPPSLPSKQNLDGVRCRLEPADPDRHAAALFDAFAADGEGRLWTYLPYGPFPDAAAYRGWLAERAGGNDPLFFAIIDRQTERPIGIASYLRIAPEAGSIEAGHLCFSPALQGSAIATEAMYVMMRNAFALGYRRYEWKCDLLNAKSMRAAQRFGFSYEGVFRQATVYKGRNRDTAWYAITDGDWPALQHAYEVWLAAENFDVDGKQRRSLSDLTQPLLRRRFADSGIEPVAAGR